jgi:hypothetical protein
MSAVSVDKSDKQCQCQKKRQEKRKEISEKDNHFYLPKAEATGKSPVVFH